MDSSCSRAAASLAGRRVSHNLASTSGREAMRRPGRSRLQVDAALFEPPPFQPGKLSVQYLAGAAVTSPARSSSSSCALPLLRRYTLTHNDITGALQLSIGHNFNQRQVQGFYTRILRDEITAEWLFGRGGVAPAELHIYCHVSGEERWLAPPQLRNFIFRREMTLVLDTFVYADQQLLQAYPNLLKAKVYVHFQSDVQDLDLREYWGVLGDRTTWRRMPKGVLARLKLLLFGFPAVPHQRPRHALTHQQQEQQQQQRQPEQAQQPGVLVPAAATAAAGNAPADCAVLAGSNSSNSSSSGDAGGVDVHRQWHPQAELAVESTRPVALSLQERRQAQAHQLLQEQEQCSLQDQQQQRQQSVALLSQQMQHQAGGCTCCSCVEAGQQGSPAATNGTSCSDAGSLQQPLPCAQQQLPQSSAQQQGEQAAGSHPQQQQQHQQCAGDAVPGSGHSSSSSRGSSNSSTITSSPVRKTEQQLDAAAGSVEQQQQQQQQQREVLPRQQRLQEQLGQMETAAMVDALLEYGRWSVRDPQLANSSSSSSPARLQRQLVQAATSASSSSSGGGGGSNVLSAAMLGGQQMLLQSVTCASVVLATANAVVDAGGSTAGRCQ